MALNQRLRFDEAAVQEPLEEDEEADRRAFREADPATGPTNGEAETGATGTFEDLVREDTFDDRRGTLELDKTDVPIEVEGLPIPKPWQGIQRAAVVFNLGFVFDESEDRWVRQKKSNLREASLVADGVVTVASGGGQSVEGIGITEPDISPDVLLPNAGLAEDPGQNVELYRTAAITQAGTVGFGHRWRDGTSEYEFVVINNTSVQLDIQWRVDRIPGP